MKRISLLFILFIFSVSIAFAVKAYPGLVTKNQSDGSTISFYIHGDENFHYCTSEDGFLLVEVDGIYEYAIVDGLYNFKSTGVKANNVSKRDAIEQAFLISMPKALDVINDIKFQEGYRKNIQRANRDMKRVSSNFPLTGSPKSLVILVNFADKKFTSPTAKEDYSRLLNEVGYADNGATSSARDYFITSSNGLFQPNFVVVGPYDLPRNYAFYGEEKDGQHDYAPGQMIVDACNAADADVDFTEFDTDKDGILDNVFVYYAGHNQAEGGGANTIWPHRSAIMSMIKCDGVKLYDYACTSEFRGASGESMCGIGTFCHEFGHVLGLPDLYVTDYSSSHDTPGRWDIMDNGSYNNKGRTPPTYSSYARFFLGWLEPIQITGGNYTLKPLIESNEAYLFAVEDHNLNGKKPNPVEFFMLENRQQIGIDELGVPANGMLVTHIYYDEGTWNNNRPNNDPDKQGVQILCAYGTTAAPMGNTFPGGRGITSCYFTLRDGTEMPTPLSNIKSENRIITFEYPVGDNYPRIEVKGLIDDFDVDFGETAIKTVELIGSAISEQVHIIFKDGRNFKIREHSDDSESDFLNRITCEPNLTDSSFHVLVDILFNPQACTYNDFIEERLIVTSGEYTNRFSFKARAKRPVIVVPPHAKEAIDVTPYSFVANWNGVVDANEYYLDVYSVEDIESSDIEEFSSFDGVGSEGWSSNFKAVTTSNYKSAPQAAYFTSALDTIWTKEYFMPVSKLSFWVNAINSTGVLFVEGKLNDGNWMEVKREEITKTTRSKTITVDLDTSLKIQEFKIYYETLSKTGGLAFDDFIAYLPQTRNYVLDGYTVTDTVCRVWGLIPNSVYLYDLKASDIDLDVYPPRYNNVTAPSNVVTVTTLEGSSAEDKELSVLKGDNCYRVFVPDYDYNYSLFVYTLDGRLVKEISSTTNEFVVSGLVVGDVYILKYAEKGTLRRKTKVAKLYYNL
ncbi:MAG: M6 family metalloprotease domain-containing protein [Paludibacteraceae bacterium]|nr:M6 family metalloprotease domain-containing protein [Paludibacteraceae bacterium]